MGCNARRTGTKIWTCRCCDARADYEYWACGAVTREWWSGARPAPAATTRPEPDPARTAERILRTDHHLT